jgi:hypothetical protein
MPQSSLRPAGALPADVAAKANHQSLARHLRAVAAGTLSGLQPPSKEALVKRFAAAGSGAHNSSKGSGKGWLSQWNEGDSAADLGASASEWSEQAAAGIKEGAAATAQQEAAAKRLTQRGFEGWGTPGACALPSFPPPALLPSVSGAAICVPAFPH